MRSKCAKTVVILISENGICKIALRLFLFSYRTPMRSRCPPRLHGDMKEAYLDPSSLRLPDPPSLPKGKICGSRPEFTRFAQRADDANGIEIFGDDELEKDKDGNVVVAGFFYLRKSLLQDRTITSRLAQNRRERPLRRSAHLLAHGVLLGEAHLRKDEKARLSGTDLPNAYHRAGVSVQRAKTYAVGGKVAAREFARGPAFQRMIQRRRDAGLVPVVPAQIRLAWRSLAMGDLNGVCFMTSGHLNLFASARRGSRDYALPKSDSARTVAGRGDRG